MEHDTQEGPEWLTIPDASEVSGISIGTLMAWTRAGTIGSQLSRGPDGEHRVVRIQEVLERARPTPSYTAQGDASTEGSASSVLAPLMAAIPDLIRDLADARDRAARAETKADFLREQVVQLRSQLHAESSLVGEQTAQTVIHQAPPRFEDGVADAVETLPTEGDPYSNKSVSEGHDLGPSLDPVWANVAKPEASDDEDLDSSFASSQVPGGMIASRRSRRQEKRRWWQRRES